MKPAILLVLLFTAATAFAKPAKKERPHFDPHYKCAVIETGKITVGVLKGTDTEQEIAKIELFVSDEANPETGAIAKQAFARDHEFTATWSTNLVDRAPGTQALTLTVDDKVVFETEFNRKRNRDSYSVPVAPGLRVDCHP